MQRHTRQRAAICQALAESSGPLDAAGVLAAARRSVPRLGMATVYRALKALCEQGWLVRIEVPGRGAYYERADKDHHHHFLCRDCGRLFEVNGCLGDVRDVAPDGCLVEEHELLLHGLCAQCRPPAAGE